MTACHTLHRSVAAAAALCLLGACSSFDKASKDQAERMEAAIQRQQLEPEKPATDNKLVYLDMIKTMQSRSLYFASLAHIDAYRKLHGDSPEIMRLEADALRATGQAEAADKAYRRLLDTTEAAAAWRGLGLLAAQRGDYAAAVAALQESTRHDPINATALSDLGYALLQNGEFDAARLPLIQAAELAPDNRKIASNLALYLMLSGENDKARQLMDKAGLPQETREEIARQAIASGQPSSQAAPTRTLASATHDNGMQLQLQWQLLEPAQQLRQ